MDFLKIVLTDLDQNQESIFYSVELTNNIRLEWRSEATKNKDLYYQITIRNKNQDNFYNEAYYFINDLFTQNILDTKLENLDSIVIEQNDNTYEIDGGNIFSISTNNSEYGIEVLIILENLDQNTNLPFIEQQTPSYAPQNVVLEQEM